MIRKAFAAKAGQAIQERVETASRLHDGLMQANDGEALNDLRHQRPRLQGLLQKLAAYYQAVPGESSHFIKDPNEMKRITRTMAQREGLACSLARALQDV